MAPQLSAEQQAQLQALQEQESSALQPPTTEGVVRALSLRSTASKPFNEITGTPKGETINGTDAKDNIASLGGDDTIYGKAGVDAISGGSENDKVYGGDGDDVIYGDYSPSENSDLVGSGNDTLYGDAGNDFLYGQDREDKIYGGAGDDYAEGGKGDDIIYGGNGIDFLYGDGRVDSPGVSGNDQVYGGNGNDEIYGGQGQDTLEGESGSDKLVGGQRNDSLSGGDGKDILIGTDTYFFGQLQGGFGFGEIDTLIGGRNDDTFVLGLAQANARDANGNDTVVMDVVLYNDGNNVNFNGILDFARIKDFGFSGDNFERGADKIELAGSQDMYSLGASPIKDISGTAIFLNKDQPVPELIGIVEGISASNLSLTNPNRFTFV